MSNSTCWSLNVRSRERLGLHEKPWFPRFFEGTLLPSLFSNLVDHLHANHFTCLTEVLSCFALPHTTKPSIVSYSGKFTTSWRRFLGRYRLFGHHIFGHSSQCIQSHIPSEHLDARKTTSAVLCTMHAPRVLNQLVHQFATYARAFTT